jgi:hypothetical protein
LFKQLGISTCEVFGQHENAGIRSCRLEADHIPDLNIGFLTVCWYDKDEAAKTGAAQ